MPETLDARSSQAAEWIQSRWPATPKFGIVLGTGAGQLADRMTPEAIFPYSEIPHFPRSTALGHKGQLVCGKLCGQPVVAMQGRFHLYEGYDVDHSTLAIHTMHRLGVRQLMISNAAGGINPKFRSGEIMLINSHIDLMNRSSRNFVGPQTIDRPLVRCDLAYDRNLIQQALQCARRNGFQVHQGVYVGMLGPNFETRAEYRFLRRIGGDTVGMSTVPEVYVAARYGIRVLAMSIVTNVAKPDVLDATSGEEVIDAAKLAAPHLRALVENAISANS